jgi:hypothetical protein
MPPARFHAVQIAKSNPQLAEEISRYSQADTCTRIGHLLTLPHYHANTIRLETLQHLAVSHARGSFAPSSGRIQAWLNTHLGSTQAAFDEDSPEDVFITTVTCSRGSMLLFEGTWESNDFWVQSTLDTLRTLSRNHKWASTLLESSIALLAIGDLVARRNSLSRYEPPADRQSRQIALPGRRDLELRSKFSVITPDDLDRLELSRASIDRFIAPSTFDTESLDLETTPLVSFGDNLVLAIPANVGAAIRLLAARDASSGGCIDEYDRVQSSRQLATVASFVSRDFKVTLEPPPSREIQNKNGTVAHEILGRFNRTSPCQVIYLYESVSSIAAQGLDSFSSDVFSPAIERIDEWASSIGSESNPKDALSLVIIGGNGGGMGLSANPPQNPAWQLMAFSLPDIQMICRSREHDILDVWSLIVREDQLQANNVRMFYMNGPLQLLSSYLEYGERLLPQNFPYVVGHPSMLTIGPEMIYPIRHKLRVANDRHASILSSKGAILELTRLTNRSYFRETESLPIYVSDRILEKGNLVGAVETQDRTWWVILNQCPQGEFHRDMFYRIWEAVLQWTYRIADIAERRITGLPNGNIELVLDFDLLESFDGRNIHKLESANTKVSLAAEGQTVVMRPRPGLFYLLSKPENLGERTLVEATFAGLLLLSNGSIDKPLARSFANEAIPCQGARFVHLLTPWNYRTLAHRSSKFQEIRLGNINYANLGFGYRITDTTEPHAISDARACNQFLHKAVDLLWSDIREHLRRIDRHDLLVYSLKNSESCERDQVSWDVGARALLSLHSDPDNIIGAAMEQSQLRARTGLASRILAEMALCECPAEDGSLITPTEFGDLMAKAYLMISYASQSDAIKFQLATPTITIHQNGEFEFDLDYQRSIVEPYIQSHFSILFNHAAANYDTKMRMSDPETKEQSAETTEPSLFTQELFVVAFSAEFGLSPSLARDAVRALQDDALDTEAELVISRSLDGIQNTLRSGGLSDRETVAFLDSFTLQYRSRWDEAPDGFENKDWYPWRHRRRLSLVARPLIRTGLGGNTEFVYAPALVAAAQAILLNRLIEGDLPAEYFKSPEMRSWIGKATHESGTSFEQEVADLLRPLGFLAHVNVPMTQLGGHPKHGDVDVIAWNPNEETILLIECKNLRFAKTVAEIGEQLREFAGRGTDRLARHLRRCEFLESNPNELLRFVRRGKRDFKLRPLLVTSTVVPMQFTAGLPISQENIVSAAGLSEAVLQAFIDER